jgi:hypothetical protein
MQITTIYLLAFFPFRRISFFTGKTAASEVVRRKSAPIEERGNGDVTNDQSLPVAERKQQEESSRNSLGGPNDQLDASMSGSVSTKKSVHSGYSMMNFPANSNLTTPMCWSKHAALLGDVVGIDTSNQVTRWSCDQVMDFLAKFGVNKVMLEKFKQEVCSTANYFGLYGIYFNCFDYRKLMERRSCFCLKAILPICLVSSWDRPLRFATLFF